MVAVDSVTAFRRFFSLSGADRRLLVEAWWRLVAAAIRLRFAPERAVATALADSRPHPPRGGVPIAAEDVALAVSRAAAHHLRAMTCLPRSLALRTMLARRGISSRLRIGVRKESGTVAAHAWIEVDGRPVGEPAAIEERFLPLVASEKA